MKNLRIPGQLVKGECQSQWSVARPVAVRAAHLQPSVFSCLLGWCGPGLTPPGQCLGQQNHVRWMFLAIWVSSLVVEDITLFVYLTMQGVCHTTLHGSGVIYLGQQRTHPRFPCKELSLSSLLSLRSRIWPTVLMCLLFLSEVQLLLEKRSADEQTPEAQPDLHTLVSSSFGHWYLKIQLKRCLQQYFWITPSASLMIFDVSTVSSSWSYRKMYKYPFSCRGSGYTGSWVCKLSERSNPVKCLCGLSCIKYCSSHLIYLRKVKGSVTPRLASVVPGSQGIFQTCCIMLILLQSDFFF